jgi:tetratricopeptide (TPR) repeat protein
VRYEQWPGYAESGYLPTDFELAVKLMHADDVGGARKLFQRFLEQRPDSYEAVWGLSLCDFRDGEVEQAKAVIERALEMTDRDALSFEAYADILDALGSSVEAIRYYEKALELSPNSRRLARKWNAVRERTDG